MPELVKWVNDRKYDGGRLSEAQKRLRSYYGRLLALADEPGFRFGGFRPLNPANGGSAGFGKVEGDPSSGHWMYAFLRYDPRSQQRWLVVANLHPSAGFSDVHIRVPEEAVKWMEAPEGADLVFEDELESGMELRARAADLPGMGIVIPKIPALSAMYFRIL
jgi:hypothetical protein